MSVLRPHLRLHLGDRCAALVDGQLGVLEEERAWQHVLVCPPCRDAVEQQVAAKQVLGGLRPVDDHPDPPTSWLRHPDALTAWEQVVEVEHRSRRRTTLLGAIGGGALTASLAAALVVGATPTAPASRPAPDRLGAELAPPAIRTVPAQPTSWSTGWTGTATGSETTRTFRGDRSD